MKASKRLAFMLRHSQEPLYIDLDGGWAYMAAKGGKEEGRRQKEDGRWYGWMLDWVFGG